MPYKTDKVIERARELVDAKVPFLHQGRDFSGIDCVGALVYAFQYEGEIPAYPRDPVNGELEKSLEHVFGKPLMVIDRFNPLTTANELQPKDIISIQYRGPIRHVAIVAEYPDQRNYPGARSMIHTDSNVEKVTEHILDRKWLRRIVKVWRP